MKDFDIVKYLKENKQGAYGMFNGYVDLKPLKEEESTPAEDTADDETETVPYEAEEDQLTGLGDTDSFEQEDIVSENDQMDMFADDEDFYSGTYSGDSRAGGLVNQLDLKKIAEAVVSIIEDLESDGYHPEEIQEFLIDKVREVCRPYMK